MRSSYKARLGSGGRLYGFLLWYTLEKRLAIMYCTVVKGYFGAAERAQPSSHCRSGSVYLERELWSDSFTHFNVLILWSSRSLASLHLVGPRVWFVTRGNK